MNNDCFPSGYFITFTTYGNWVHADARGSVHRDCNQFGTPKVIPNKKFEYLMRSKLRHKPFLLDEKRRFTLLESIKLTCKRYQWFLYAAHIRTNHIHVLLHARETSTTVAMNIKAHATRYLKKHHADISDQTLWTRGQSIKWIWKPEFLPVTRDYIIERQGEKMAWYSDSMFDVE